MAGTKNVPPGPVYKDGETLKIEDVDLGEIVAAVETPFYLYSHGEILRRFNAFEDSLTGYDHLICYAMKANSNGALVYILSCAGAGADVVSGGEFFRALEAGVPPERIVFAGVGKTEAEIRYALEKGLLGLNVESLSELDEIEEIAEEMELKAPVSIRVQPEISSGTHPYLSTAGEPTKFGVPREKAVKAYRKISRSAYLKAVGIHVHIGSQIREKEPYLRLGKFLWQLLVELEGMGIEPDYVDFGGGFGIAGKEDTARSVPEPAEFVAALLSGFGPGAERFCLIVEPGRSIVGPAGLLVGKVLRQKTVKGKTFTVTDVGMNDFLRPSLYGSYHKISGLSSEGKLLSSRGKSLVDLVGPVCESGDFIGKDRKLSHLSQGDYVLIHDAGAYGMSMASNYNSRPRPAEILVKEGDFEMIRERESVKDLLTLERQPDFLSENAG